MMKLQKIGLTALLATICAMTSTLALTSCKNNSLDDNGLEYILNADDNSYSVRGVASSKKTDIVIPSTYNGKPVTELKDNAFQQRNGLNSVEIADSVTSIGQNAFYECNGLASVVIGKSVSWIGQNAFKGCSALSRIDYKGDVAGWCNISFVQENANPLSYTSNLYIGNEPVTDLVVPSTVTEIKAYAFYNYGGLTSVVISDGVTSIGEFAFAASGLTSVKLPNNVTIGDDAFYYCSALTRIEYNGTKAEWQALSKGTDWNHGTGNYTVSCTDGELSK